MAVTIQQIANRVGVSPSTVSAALSPVCKKRISQKRINEISSLAKKMGYKPNLSARRLRTGKTYNIGVVIFSYLHHHPLMTYFDLVSEHLSKKGYRAIPLQVCRDYDEVPEKLHELEEHHVDGLLFLDYYRGSYDEYIRLWQTNHSMVFRVRDPSFFNVPFESVLVDHLESGRNLVKHLITEGWTDLVFVTEEVSMSTLHDYHRYVNSFFDFGDNSERVRRQNLLHHGRSGQSRYQAAKKFIAEGRIVPSKTCLVLDGGDGASGVYAACQEAGLVIGRDVAVAAMNRLPANECVYPELTVISEPYDLIAKSLVKKLLASVEDRTVDDESNHVFQLELMAKPSTVRSK